MNTNDVERRLEALASSSADPDVPAILLDRLARFDANEEPALAPVRMEAVRASHMVRTVGGPRSRGLLLMGVAAVLATAGGLFYVAGGHPSPTGPQPSRTFTTERQSSATAEVSLGSIRPQPMPPLTVGSWKKTYTFSGNLIFGNIYGSDVSPVILTWQNGEIVGLAQRTNGNGVQQTCVLQSKDGSNWKCSVLPNPPGTDCSTNRCPTVTGLAVRGGRWVAVGSLDVGAAYAPPDPSSGPTPEYEQEDLTWTSTDGTTWTEHTSARYATTIDPGGDALGSPARPVILTTPGGFLMSRCVAGQSGLWTSADGLNWKPAAFSQGSQMLSCGHLGNPSAAGYAATGQCQTGTAPHDCVAFSVDGTTWTTSDPIAGVSQGLAGNLGIVPVGPVYASGRWIVSLESTAPFDTSVFESSSSDGIGWSMSPVSTNQLATSAGVGESDYHGPVFSELAQSGYWGINPAGLSPSSLYWSLTGNYWQRVADAPPGWPVAVVETPTGLVALMGTGSAASYTTTVWVASKR